MDNTDGDNAVWIAWSNIQAYFKKMSILKIHLSGNQFSGKKTQNYEKQKSIEMRKAFNKDSTLPDIITEQKLFSLEIQKNGNYVLGVTQKAKGNMSSQDSEKHQYSDVRAYLINIPKELEKNENNKTKLDKGSIYVDGNLRSDQRDFYIEANLNAGKYALIVEIDWKIHTNEKTFSITSYGPEEVVFNDSTDLAISEVLRSASDSIFKKFKSQI